MSCSLHRINNEDLGQVRASFPTIIVIYIYSYIILYTDHCILVLQALPCIQRPNRNLVCHIHSEIYQSKHLCFSDSHFQMCLLIFIVLIHCIAKSPRSLGRHHFSQFLTVFGQVSGEDQRTLWLCHARGTWDPFVAKGTPSYVSPYVSCHPIKHIQNPMRALRIPKDTRKVSRWLTCETKYIKMIQCSQMSWPEGFGVYDATYGWKLWEYEGEMVKKFIFNFCSKTTLTAV